MSVFVGGLSLQTFKKGAEKVKQQVTHAAASVETKIEEAKKLIASIEDGIQNSDKHLQQIEHALVSYVASHLRHPKMLWELKNWVMGIKTELKNLKPAFERLKNEFEAAMKSKDLKAVLAGLADLKDTAARVEKLVSTLHSGNEKYKLGITFGSWDRTREAYRKAKEFASVHAAQAENFVGNAVKSQLESQVKGAIAGQI